jgi:lysozyme
MMKTSDSGRKMIEGFEGLSLHAYHDSRGIPTIGFGHTSAAGSPYVIMGMVITNSQADAILEVDLSSVEKQVTDLITVPLTQFQFDALVSFQYNTGWLAHPQCSLRTSLNSGNYQLADQDFMLYDYAGGKPVPGLERRRMAEKTLFLTGQYPTTY